MKNNKPLISKLNETQVSNTLTPLPEGFLIEGARSSPKFRLPVNSQNITPSEEINTEPYIATALKVLTDLQILNKNRTYLEISGYKDKISMSVKTNLNVDLPYVSRRTIFKLESFGSSGFLLSSGKEKEKLPYRPILFKQDTLKAAIEAFAHVKIKPTIAMVGMWSSLSHMYPDADTLLVAAITALPHPFHIMMLLVETDYFPLEELETARTMPTYFLEPLLLQVL